jgi:hypothetical protein
MDHEALKALICTQHEQLLSQAEELLTKNEQLASREVEIERELPARMRNQNSRHSLGIQVGNQPLPAGLSLNV